ncbi:unnamed protein product [Caenorhabditis sp. 36 PRJEB53466]|nr:unnamed protein product [Caenorhabditis sp. 36 PRJEB53466]
MSQGTNQRPQTLRPQTSFFTPEDAVHWATILRARYLNDCISKKTLNKTVRKPITYVKQEIKTESDDSEYENCRRNERSSHTNSQGTSIRQQTINLISFSEALKRPQKPNLFGPSIVSINSQF